MMAPRAREAGRTEAMAQERPAMLHIVLTVPALALVLGIALSRFGDDPVPKPRGGARRGRDDAD